MKVLLITYWQYAQDSCGEGGLSAQVTKCEHEGVVFYVRENTNNVPSFMIHSGVRWGDKAGSKPAPQRQRLELCAPAAKWNELAALVRQLDTLQRPVGKSRLFTPQWAEKQFKKFK